MVVRISRLLLRLCVGLAAILGILFWVNILTPAGGVLEVHETLGILVVVLLWVLGLALMVRGGNLGLALVALAWGVLVTFVGFQQDTLLPGVDHQIIRALHLLLGLASAGLGEACAVRYGRVQSRKDVQVA
jgi:hypothetical protein